jgi:hypothetical protein
VSLLDLLSEGATQANGTRDRDNRAGEEGSTNYSDSKIDAYTAERTGASAAGGALLPIPSPGVARSALARCQTLPPIDGNAPWPGQPQHLP